MKIRPGVLAVIVVVPLLIAAASLGLWVVSGDARMLARNADAFLFPPEIIVPNRGVLVKRMQDLARLETASMDIAQNLRAQRGTDGSWGWFGERMDFEAHGEVVAGVDLSKLADGDLSVNPETGVVTVRLPPAEVWHVDFDEQKSAVRMRERGWLGWPDADFESRVRREAEKSLERAAVDRGIVKRANTQAEVAVRDLLVAGGAAEVRFAR